MLIRNSSTTICLSSSMRSGALNNGYPSFLAFLIEQLELKEGDHVVHVGCGPGYYTAVIAEVVGTTGQVTAMEIDSQLARRAESNLSYLAQVKIIEGDGGEENPGPCDAILVNAGATHPRSIWLDSLRTGGRLILPLTVTGEEGGTEGAILKITREHRRVRCLVRLSRQDLSLRRRSGRSLE